MKNLIYTVTLEVPDCDNLTATEFENILNCNIELNNHFSDIIVATVVKNRIKKK